MTSKNRSTILGVFDTREQGHRAVEELRRAGFSDNQITMVMHHDDDHKVEITDMDAAKAAQATGENKAGEGVAIGAVAGGVGGGALAAAMALIPGVIPGIGPVLSLGTMAVSLFSIGTTAAVGVGAAVGATGGGIIGGLLGADFPEDEARFYEKELKAGRILVGVSAGDRAEEARAILDRCGGYHAMSAPALAGAAEVEHGSVVR